MPVLIPMTGINPLISMILTPPPVYTIAVVDAAAVESTPAVVVLFVTPAIIAGGCGVSELREEVGAGNSLRRCAVGVVTVVMVEIGRASSKVGGGRATVDTVGEIVIEKVEKSVEKMVERVSVGRT